MPKQGPSRKDLRHPHLPPYAPPAGGQVVKILLLRYLLPYAPSAGGQVDKVILLPYLLPYAPPAGGQMVKVFQPHSYLLLKPDRPGTWLPHQQLNAYLIPRGQPKRSNCMILLQDHATPKQPAPRPACRQGASRGSYPKGPT